MNQDPTEAATASTRAIAFMDSQMANVCPGDITLKDEGTRLQWAVRLRPFLMARFAVTQGQYSAVFGTPQAAREERKKPVVDLSWIDAVRFCNLLSIQAGLAACYEWDSDGEVSCAWDRDGYRLPSEAEWEYACRAGSNGVRYGELDRIAWYSGNSGDMVHEVGTRDPNAWGLHDMIGNVWEWCWDVYDRDVYGPYRVFRGGGWSDSARGCRASCRRKSHPTFHIDDLGFRLARSLRPRSTA